MVTAAINIARAGTVTFRPTDTPPGQLPRNLPLNLSICQTDATGTCINPTTPGPSSTLTVANNQTVFFSVFAAGQGTLMPYDPANKRIFILATIPANITNDGVLVLDPDAKLTIGAASAAVKMCVSDVNDLQSLNQNLSGNYCAGDNIVTNVGAVSGSAGTWRVLSNGKVISSSSGDTGAPTATAPEPPQSIGFLTDGAGGYLTDSNGERMTSR
jgi:hypothetical protein